MINDTLIVIVLAQAVLYGTPLLYAALGELLAADPSIGNILVYRGCFHLPGCIAWCVQPKGPLSQMSSLNDTADVLMSSFIDFVLPGADGARWSAGISSQGHIGHCCGHNRTQWSSPGHFGQGDPRAHVQTVVALRTFATRSLTGMSGPVEF